MFLSKFPENGSDVIYFVISLPHFLISYFPRGQSLQYLLLDLSKAQSDDKDTVMKSEDPLSNSKRKRLLQNENLHFLLNRSWWNNTLEAKTIFFFFQHYYEIVYIELG